ncbi:MucBP domain-containing protein [Streptococcus suis]|uniref:MucBP domain-containing protein n=1 Tax=Streptococcus suis TaxID=1307 RepID=UPI003F593AE3
MRHNGKNQMFPDKRQRFSIRKFKTGVASVVFVALFLGNMATVAAEQVPTNTDSSAKEVMESDVALPTDETLDKVPTTDEEVAPIEEGVDASLAPLESAEAPQEFRAAVGTERSAATNTKGVVVTPGQGIKTISEIPTDGFTTTEPEVKSMNPNFTGTVNHDPQKYTFAVIKTDKYNNWSDGPLYVNKDGVVETSSSRGATLVHQMAFSTDRDGTGNVYINMYGSNGKLLMSDALVPELRENELKYVYNGWFGRTTTYTIQHREVITNNGNFPIASVSTSNATDGWFDELYTNYEKALGYTNGRYMGYGWFVPRLIDKKTEYVVKDSNKVLATVTQTEMSGYKFTTAAPETITADGVTYKLIKDSGVNTSGLINPLVMAGDATAVGTDKGYFIRYLMKDEAGQNIEWELLDPNNEVATTTDGKPARGTLRYGEDKKTYATVRVKSTNTDTTFYINNPYFPGGRTVYYYEVVPTSEVPKGSVTVKHVTTTGEVLKEETSVKTNEPVGTPYETQPEDKIVTDNGRTFVYRGLKEDSADPKGEVKEGTQKVTFVYEEVKGNVTVEHVTTDGKVLKAETPVFSENQSTGTAYETKNETELKDEAGNVYVFKEHKADSAPVSGKVTETAQKVVYVYELKPVTPTPTPTPDAPKGDVTVEHVTTTGEVLKKETPVKTDEPVGTPYETQPEDKIVTDNGRTFKYKEVDKTSAQPKGEVKEGTQKVTFVYEEVKGNVTVEHVTTDGKVLKAETPVFSENQSTGTAYETKNETELKDEAGNVYVFKEHKADSAPVSGKVTETAQKVVYVYELKPVTPTPTPTPTPDAPKGDVTVEHVTTTGEVLKKETPVKTDEPVGTPYETQPEDKIVTDNGRTFVYRGLKEDSADPKGEVKEGTQKVTFVYEEVKGNVTVEHVTTDGKVLKAETPVFSENQSTGTAYETKNETELKDEAGNVYVFKEHKADSAPVSGKVTETAQKVVYVYELKPVTPTPTPTPTPDAPKGDVTVEHVTTTGEVLKKETPVKTDEPVGTPYETQPEDKIVTDNGRTFVYKGLKEDSADPKGEVKEGTQKVTFVYEEVKGNVTVEHVTTDGKVLKAETPVFSENQSTGTAYETKNETELKDEAGNVYVFKEHKADSAPVSGEVTETAQKVVYVYELKPVTPTPTPEVSKPKSTTPATPTQDSSIPTSVVSTNKAQLPNAGEDNSAAFATLGTAMLVATFAFNGKRRQDEN